MAQSVQIEFPFFWILMQISTNKFALFTFDEIIFLYVKVNNSIHVFSREA